MHPIKHTSLSGYRCVYTSANQRNNVTFVFQRKGELTNKRGEFPLKKRSLCKWPLYDCNRRVESNFFPKRPQSIPRSFPLYEQSGALDKKANALFRDWIDGRSREQGESSAALRVCYAVCTVGESLPAQRSPARKWRLEEKNPFLNGQIKPQLRKAVGFIKASWLKMGPEESCEVDGAWPCISTTHFPLNSSRRRIAPVLFIAGQRLFFFSPSLIQKIPPGVESGVWRAEGDVPGGYLCARVPGCGYRRSH